MKETWMIAANPAAETSRLRVDLNHGYVWRISSVAALGGLLFGWDWVVIGGAKPFFQSYFQLISATEIGWANSCALIGCLVGALAKLPETKGQTLEEIEKRLLD